MPDVEIPEGAGGAEGQPEGAEPEPGSGEPQWAQFQYRKEREKRHKEREKREAAEAKASALEAEMAMIRQRVASLEAPRQPEKAEPALDDLLALKQRVETFRHIVTTETDEDAVAAARAELRKVRPDQMVALDTKIAELKAMEQSKAIRGDMNTERQASQAKNAMQLALAKEFGDQVMNLNSELMQQAAQEYAKLIPRFGRDDNGAVTWLAVKAAHEAVNRGGRGTSELDRRRLAIESEGRRMADTGNKIAALRSKGDPKSASKAVDLEIDAIFGNLGMG